jgi:DNA-binding beta-propeller fold protein YncE
VKATNFGDVGSKPAVMRLGYAFVLVSSALAGCTAPDSAVRPPENDMYYPTGIAVSPDDAMLFVTNANSDLQYDSGSISVMDLAKIDKYATDWSVNGVIDTEPGVGDSGCSQDPDHTETLVCDNTDDHVVTRFMIPNTAARVGNFATAIAVQDTGAGSFRLIVPTRGDPSVAWVDWDGSKLSCNADGQGFELCDDDHRLSYVHNDPDIGYLPEEPFDVYASSTGNYAIVTHLTTGAVTLIDSPPGRKATIADVVVGLFAADMVTGIEGSTGVSARISPGADDIVYVGARSEDRIQTFTVGRPINNAAPYLVQGNFFFLDAVGGNAGLSEDTRGMTFSTTGDQMYLINREPPSLQVYDTSLKTTGLPANKGIGATDICREASKMTALDTGDGERIYITCFSDGQLYVVDPRGQSYVEDIISVGRGPYAVATAPSRKKIYVTNFLENTVAVIDVAPGSPTRNRVILRIGTVKPP